MSDAATRFGQQGMALIAALFLIVVLAGLGLYAVRVGGSQQQTANFSLLNARALAAATSGLEYGANQVLLPGGQPCPAPFVPPLNTQGLNGFVVTVNCNSFQYLPGKYVYTLTAFAQSGTYGSPNYAASTLTRTVP